MKETFLKLQTEIIYAAMSGIMRLPDKSLAELMAAFHALARLNADSDERETVMLLAELVQYFREGPPMSDHLRRMLLTARPEQIKSVIRGYLVNYVYNW